VAVVITEEAVWIVVWVWITVLVDVMVVLESDSPIATDAKTIVSTTNTTKIVVLTFKFPLLLRRE
jgi:hypothetical protein